MFSGCGYHFPALAWRARGVLSRPRHVRSCSTDDEHLLNVGSQTARSPRRGGTEGRARGVPRRSEPRSLQHQPQTWLSETREKWASVKTNRARHKRRDPSPPPPHPPTPPPTPPPPKKLRTADPRNGGRPQNWTGANPRTGLQVPCAVYF